jgi:hypothetical protein
MKKLSGNPWLGWMPFLLLYVVLIALGHRDAMEGDEGRYFMFAQHLAEGFYSPREGLNLWNGPGYPLVLVPFVWLQTPLLWAVLLNAVFQYASLVMLYKSLRLLVSNKLSLIFSLIWAFYYVAYKELAWLYTEPLSSCLIACFLFYFIRSFLSVARKKDTWIAGGLIGYLALTKVIFGYVILIMLLGLLAARLLRREEWVKKSFLIWLIALLVNFPYLIYTFQLTGKPFYWANSGGMSFYWASTPVEAEFGDWNDDHFTAYCGYDPNQPCNAAQFAVHHQADYDSIFQLQGVARDEAFRQKAWQNIRQHPVKYVKNCVANAGRLFFGLPFSYHYFRMAQLMRIPAGALVFFLFVFAFVSSFFYRGQHKNILLILVVCLCLFLGATLVVSAYQRMLTVMVPLILLLSAVYLDHWLQRLRSSSN